MRASTSPKRIISVVATPRTTQTLKRKTRRFFLLSSSSSSLEEKREDENKNAFKTCWSNHPQTEDGENIIVKEVVKNKL